MQFCVLNKSYTHSQTHAHIQPIYSGTLWCILTSHLPNLFFLTLSLTLNRMVSLALWWPRKKWKRRNYTKATDNTNFSLNADYDPWVCCRDVTIWKIWCLDYSDQIIKDIIAVLFISVQMSKKHVHWHNFMKSCDSLIILKHLKPKSYQNENFTLKGQTTGTERVYFVICNKICLHILFIHKKCVSVWVRGVPVSENECMFFCVCVC